MVGTEKKDKEQTIKEPIESNQVGFANNTTEPTDTKVTISNKKDNDQGT